MGLDESSERLLESPLRRAAPAVMLHRLSGHLKALLACGVARLVARDEIELVLEPAEAAEGGMAQISMSVPVGCDACAGRAPTRCPRCLSTGTVDALFSAWLAIEPGTRDGAMLEPTEWLPGMTRPVKFRVRIV